MSHQSCLVCRLLVLGLMSLAAAACAQTSLPPLAPYPLPAKAAGGVTALAAQSDVLILGELHGTREVPEVAASFLPKLNRLGYRALALEAPADQQPALADWATGKSSHVPAFYNGPHDDGRGNVQMLTLVRTALSAPYHWKVFCFDVSSSRPGDTWQDRDAGMARNFSTQWLRLDPDAKILALCGNLHARTENHATSDDPLAALWPSCAADLRGIMPGKRIRSINVAPRRGGFFNDGQINALSGPPLSEAITRHQSDDGWDLELCLPHATPATFLAPIPTQAAGPPSLTRRCIEEVRITGNHRVPTADILRVVRSKPGRSFLSQALMADVMAIYALNDFAGVGPFDVQKTPRGGVIVTIPVQERSRVPSPALTALPNP